MHEKEDIHENGEKHEKEGLHKKIERDKKNDKHERKEEWRQRKGINTKSRKRVRESGYS